MVFSAAASSVDAGEMTHRVAYDNCGVDGQQPHVNVKSGNYTFSKKEIPFSGVPKESELRTIIFGDRKVGLLYGGLKPSARYTLKLRFLSDHDNRVQRVRINDMVVLDQIALPQNELLEKEILIPAKLYADAKMQVSIETVEGLNSVLSEAELFSDTPGLNPHMELEYAPMPGPAVAGRVIDLNSGKPLAGAKIALGAASTTSNVDGTFSIPVETLAASLQLIATKGKLRVSKTLQAADFDAFRIPRLSPRPALNERISLNGTWNFLESVPPGFPQETSALTQKIQVPGEWVMQGYEVAKNTPAAFHRTFSIPASMKGQRIKLRFDAVYSDCTVYVNGQEAGRHMGGFTPFELDVTDLAKLGAKNELALRVQNESLADTMASGSKYACHPLGGISRKVTLFALPEVNISALAIRTDLDEDYRDATLEIELQIANEGATPARSWVRYTLGGPTGEHSSTASVEPIKAGGVSTKVIIFPVTNPQKWDCENPNLYTLKIELSSGEKIIKKFGFKETEVKGNQLFVNGKPLKLRGCNRHEVHPLRGRSLEGDLWRRDVELFRNANINLIRTCHYPPAEELLEAADELGIFVEVEGPFCWEWKSKDPTHLTATVQQNMEMVIRSRNNPSVLCWSIANESEWGPNFAAASKAMRVLDPTRPQIFNTWFKDIQEYTEPYCEIANIHYPGYSGPPKAEKYGKRPLYVGEYIHLNAYNRLELASDRGLRDQWGTYFAKIWEEMYQVQGCLGGSIWSGIDDTFYLENDITVGYGTWGPIDGWRRPKPEWYHTKKVYSPIRIPAKQLPAGNTALEIVVENRQDFSNLNRLRIDWSLGSESGSVRADVPAKSKGTLAIQLPIPPKAGETLALDFVDPRGFTMDSFKLRVGPEKTAQKPAGNRPFRLVEKADNIVAENSDGIRYAIDRRTGLFTTAARQSKMLEFSGPHLMLLPLNSTGDTQMTGKTLRPEPFTHTCRNWQADSVQVKGNTIVVKGHYDEAEGTFTYRFNPDGTFAVDYDFATTAKLNPRQLGIVFDLPADFGNLQWKRRGLWTTYPDWHIGRLEGIVSSTDGIEATSVGPKTKPQHEWRFDRGPAGSRDFASTKHNVFTASLIDPDGFGLGLVADGDRHVRVWIHGEDLRLLAAHYSNGGSERFLRSLSHIDDQPLAPGDRVKSATTFKLVGCSGAKRF